MAKGVVEDASLTVGEDEGQGFDFVAPIGFRGGEDVDGGITLETGV